MESDNQTTIILKREVSECWNNEKYAINQPKNKTTLIIITASPKRPKTNPNKTNRLKIETKIIITKTTKKRTIHNQIILESISSDL